MRKILFLLMCLFVFASHTFAIIPDDVVIDPVQPIDTAPHDKPYVSPTSMFKTLMRLNVPTITTPTIIELVSSGYLHPDKIVILHDYSGEAQRFSTGYELEDKAPSVITDASGTSHAAINDSNASTYSLFKIEGNAVAQTTLFITYDSALNANRLDTLLSQNAIDPISVGVEVQNSEGWTSIIRPGTPFQSSMPFPDTSGLHWRVTYEHDQPLYLSDIHLVPTANRVSNYSVRFLARPNETYTLYYDPTTTHSFGNLVYDNYNRETDVVTIEGSLVRNPNYRVPDSDGDGVLDTVDNCPDMLNSDQTDKNQNGIGDSCEDFDKDLIINADDNCPDVANPRQDDTDGDGIGDACDKEESRITEKYPWLPWVGMGYVLIMTVILFVVTSRQKQNVEPPQGANI